MKKSKKNKIKMKVMKQLMDFKNKINKHLHKKQASMKTTAKSLNNFSQVHQEKNMLNSLALIKNKQTLRRIKCKRPL